MHAELAIAIFAGLGGMLGWGLADFFAKKTIDQIGYIPSLVWGHLFGTLAFLALVLCRLVLKKPVNFPSDIATWALIATFGVVQALVYLLVYKGFGKGQLAILNPIFASFSGLTAILSIVVFGERLTRPFIMALAAVFAGILLINLDATAFRTRRIVFASIPGLQEILCATLFAALWTLFWDRLIDGQDWLVFAFLMYAFMTLALWLFSKIQKTDLSVIWKRSDLWSFVVLIGVCETVAYLAISLGYSATTMTTVVALLSGGFSLPTILLARVFLKERVTPIQTIGTLVVIAGIMLLTLR